jgi:molybdopterin/thiamine biosynthesis adenylyltransferase/rhodanese-related sulfurtransferase
MSGNNGDLTPAELIRYGRHLTLPEVGLAGQRRLKAARVLLIGAGGLGSPLGLYLAAAGIGQLGLVDFDRVEQSNLQRQIMHSHQDLGRPKVESAADRLTQVNPHVELRTYATALSADNALEILADYDVVVDGTDNFATRYLVNDACVLSGKPNVYGSIFRFEGQVSVFHPAAGGPCYRCLHPDPPPPGLVPSCAEGGVLGVLPGVIGTLQATETIKLILGAGKPLLGRLLLFDALGMRFRELKLSPDPNCPICGTPPRRRSLQETSVACQPVDLARDEEHLMRPAELAERWRQGERPQLIDVREPYEWEIANLSKYGARLLPLNQLPLSLSTLSREAKLVVYCKSGGRSEKARQLLEAEGFSAVRSLRGGLLAWRAEVDPDMTAY